MSTDPSITRPYRRKVLELIAATAAFLVTACTPGTCAGEDLSREYLVKAGFLYNFARFVEWPSEAFTDDQSPISLCVLGKDPFGGALKSIEGKTIKGRKLVINRFERIEDLPKCHILFISRSEKEDLDKIFANLKGWNVLTVADMEEFGQRGGIINFIIREHKVRFEITLDASDRAGLTISSKLLKLAKILRDDHAAIGREERQTSGRLP